jgi:protein ImuB
MVSTTINKKPPQWLALHFPRLALDLYSRAHEQLASDAALAISDKVAGRICIIDCNDVAAAAGIRVGMPTGAALGLLDVLQIMPRDQQAEAACLQRLAAWCYQFSSQVCVVTERSALLLEVAASESLFGDADNMAKHISDGLKTLGYRPDYGAAPTPEAAHVAARHRMHLRSHQDIRKHIGKLGIADLYLQPAQIQALQKTGFRTAAEIFRLPRKALARRLGPALCDYLDRLLGLRPDPLPGFRPAESFSSGMDIPETANTEGLVFPLKRLVQELCGMLRACDRGIQVFEVQLKLDKGEEKIRLTLQQASRSEAHLMMLLRERLERLQLPRPACHIRLHAPRFLACVVVQPGLLPETEQPSAQADSLVIERLQARLGADAVKGLSCLEDHRPEYSWSVREIDDPPTYTELPDRPVWLLPRPKPCRIDKYRILAGPERIETGWWDGRDCRRDYFVVRDPAGSTLWAFHEYKPQPGWYLHGLFS